MIQELIAAVVAGFWFGLGPCTISCAPLIVPLIAAAAKSKTEGVILTVIFGFGRIFSYIVLGLAAGFLGKQLPTTLPPLVQPLFIILLGVLLMLKLQDRCILKSGVKVTGPAMAFVSGIIIGFSPCIPIVSLLGLAVATQSALLGGLTGLLFGLGTMLSPMLVLGFLSGWFAKQKEFKEVIPYVSGIFLILFGIGYILLS